MRKFGILAVAAVVLLTGCGKGDTNSAAGGAVDLSQYPMQTEETLSWWMGLSANVSAVSNSFGETPLAKELEKQTGVTVEFIHPTQGQEVEQFNLLVVSNDLPDLVTANWFGFTGGIDEAIKGQVIVNLNDVLPKYSPNLYQYLQENPDVDKMVRSNEGNYYVYPFLRGDELLTTYAGPVLRKDWLDELNLPVPETIDEWDATLRAFKEQKQSAVPLSFVQSSVALSFIAGAFQTPHGFYVDDTGTVKFGPAEPEFKEYLTLMKKWIDDGLLDKNLANVDQRIIDANMLNGKSGATFASAGSGIGRWIEAARGAGDTTFDLVAAPYPVLHKGDRPFTGQKDFKYLPSSSTAITGQAKNVELAARFLDYGYSEAGQLLYNFGIEGESYEMRDGYPYYTDLITHNPDGLSMVHALGQYTMAGYSGPFIQNKGYIEQYYSMNQQKNALNTWVETDAEKHMFPLVEDSAEDIAENTKTLNDVSTYADEMFYNFIFGQTSLDEFDSYVAQMKEYGLDELLASKQEALNRYRER